MALGLLTSLGVAWGRAAWRPVAWDVPRVSGTFEHWGRAWHIVRVRRFGGTFHAWSDLATSGEPGIEPGERVRRQREHMVELQRTGQTLYPFELSHERPGWGTFASREAPREPFTMGMDTSFGWPRRCMWHQVLSSYDTSTGTITSDKLSGGILLSDHPTRMTTGFKALPLRPMYPGLAVNTLFFGVLWAGLLFAPGVVRRAARRYRGRCDRCGYDLGGLREAGCPECGDGRKAVECTG